MFVRKDTLTLSSCSLSPCCLVFGKLTHHDTFTWPAHPSSVHEKIKEKLVAHYSGTIKFLHNLYLNSKQAKDLAAIRTLKDLIHLDFL